MLHSVYCIRTSSTDTIVDTVPLQISIEQCLCIYCSPIPQYLFITYHLRVAMHTSALPTVFIGILLLQYVSLISADTSLLPAIKFEAVEPRAASILGLIYPNLNKRQTYYCPAPGYTCDSRGCCLDRTYQCCRGKCSI